MDASSLEKAAQMSATEVSSDAFSGNVNPQKPTGIFKHVKIISDKLDAIGAEARGIDRVPSNERDPNHSKLHMLFLWGSGSGSLTSASGFFLGSPVFGLSLKDSLITGIFGCMAGSIVAAYCATFGARSGLRQMVGSRITFGWWPSKALCLFNFVSVEGFSIINLVFGGQILFSLSRGDVPLEVGIVIVGVVSVVVALIGIKLVTFYEKIMFGPMIIFFLLCYICTGKFYDNESPSQGDSLTVSGNGLSFFCVAFGVTGGWAAISSDYYIYFPEDTTRRTSFMLTFLGIFVPTAFVGAFACCVASSVLNSDDMMEVYNTEGNGGLLYATLLRWNGGGKFLLVMLFLSLICNNVLNFYSVPLAIQAGTEFFHKVPRWLMTIIGFVICLACSLGGRNELSTYLGNFLPMIGYWTMIFCTILLEEDFIFRRNRRWNWEDWNSPKDLTYGIAATAAFCCGVAGAVVGMAQVYFIGPIAAKIGDYGGDVALYLSFAFSAVTYPVFRYYELKKFDK